MCQVDEEYSGPLDAPPVPSTTSRPAEPLDRGVLKNCVKCKETKASVVIKVGDAFCRGCFKEHFLHKFRAMLGKKRVILPGEKVLLAVSGGPSSCAMLHQVQQGLSQNAHKKLRFTPGLVYIDEGGALGQSWEERQSVVCELQSVFKATGFPYYIVPLEQVFSLPSSILQPAPAADGCRPADQSSLGTEGVSAPVLTDSSHTQSLLQLFSSVTSLTAREHLLHIFRQHLLVHTARSEGYSKLMTGESCTRLAVALVANISMGRGAHLASDTGFADASYNDIITVRPMRDYSAKEIAFYNHMCSVPSVFTPALDTKAKDKASIQHLTESFVIKLQADFPSTVSTIYRTSDKLQLAGSAHSSPATEGGGAKCLLCMCALDTTAEDASALQATLISEQLSQSTVPASTSSGSSSCVQGAGPGDCCSSEHRSTHTCASHKALQAVQWEHLLCYSCRLTLKDTSSKELLPRYIRTEAYRRKRRSQIREEISQYLLEDSD